MNIKSDWWKILAVFMMIYVILMGFLIPLKPGVYSVSPISLESGSIQEIKIEGYNANFDTAKELDAWLKLDTVHYIKASKIEVIDYNNIVASFDLRSNMPSKDKYIETTLLLNNDVDGYSLLPGGLSIKNNYSEALPALQVQEPASIYQWTGLKFPYKNLLYETVRNTFFHVAIWMALFLLASLAVYNSIMFLWKEETIYDYKAYSLTSIALVYGLLGLATGAVWARFTWGYYWTNDVRLNMAAVSVLLYTGYFILRGTISDNDKTRRVAGAFNIFAYVAMVPLLLVIPRMYDSLHPGAGGNPAFSGDDLDNTLRMVFYPAIISLILLGLWMAQLRTRIFKVKESQLFN